MGAGLFWGRQLGGPVGTGVADGPAVGIHGADEPGSLFPPLAVDDAVVVSAASTGDRFGMLTGVIAEPKLRSQ